MKLKAGGNKAEEERLIQTACYAVQCWVQYPEGSTLYNANYVSEQDAQALKSVIIWVQGMQSNGQFDYSGFDQLTAQADRQVQFGSAGEWDAKAGQSAALPTLAASSMSAFDALQLAP